MPVISADDWESFLVRFPEAHLLQTRAWGELKSAFGWKAVYVSNGEAGAQVLLRQVLPGLCAAYIPKGPLGENWKDLWKDVHAVCRRAGAAFLTVEPDGWEGVAAGFSLQLPGFLPGAAAVQPRRTVVLDLQGSEDDWLGRMKQKTRYNIRLAQRKWVEVHLTDDVDSFHRMALVTAQRDGFGVHALDYYRRAYQLFAPLGQCALLEARFEQRPLAGLMVFARGSRAWYFYGASSDEERSRMPTYLLQWEAMRWAARNGCRQYDLWGVPDYEEEELEAGFSGRDDGLWGVYRFKRGFGGDLLRSAGAWQVVYRPMITRFYRWWSSRRGDE